MIQAEKRREPPLAVKLQAALAQLEKALRALGVIPADCEVVKWQFDHNPALGLRAVDPVTRCHIPHQHDARYLEWLPQPDHLAKTTGRLGESKLSARDGDQGRIAKVKRISANIEQFQKNILAKTTGNTDKSKPHSNWKSAGFAKRKPQRRASGYIRRGV